MPTGALPLVRGRVDHSTAGTLIEIDALPLNKWTKIQRRLGVLKIPLLVPYQADIQFYEESVKEFSDRISGKTTDTKHVSTFADKAVKYSPHVTLAVGTASLAGSVPAGSIHPHHLMGYSITGLVLIVIAVGVLIARSRTYNSLLWNLFSSVGLMTSVPVFVFITANTYLDATSSEISVAESTRFTTLSNRPAEPLDSSATASNSDSMMNDSQDTYELSGPGFMGDITILASDLHNNLEISPNTQPEAFPQSTLGTLGEFPTSESLGVQSTTSSEYGINDESTKSPSMLPPVSRPTIALPPTFIVVPPTLTPTESAGEITEETPEPSETTAGPSISETDLTPEPSETTDPTRLPKQLNTPQSYHSTATPSNSPKTSAPFIGPGFISLPDSTQEPTEASVETTEAS